MKIKRPIPGPVLDTRRSGFPPGEALPDAPAAEERRLIEQVLGGDPESYRPLVEAHQRRIFGLVRRLLGGDAAEAEDITQESFIRAYEYLGSLEDRSRFGPWLCQIARSLCRDRLRRLDAEKRALQRREEQVRRRSIPVDNGGMGSPLSRLPPEEYEVLKLRYFDECSYEEIGARMGLTFSQVDHLMRRARERLARRIGAERERERAL